MTTATLAKPRKSRAKHPLVKRKTGPRCTPALAFEPLRCHHCGARSAAVGPDYVIVDAIKRAWAKVHADCEE